MDNSNLFGQLTQTPTPSGSSLMSTMGPQLQQMYGQLNNPGTYRGWSGPAPNFPQYAPVHNPIPMPPVIQPTGTPSPTPTPGGPHAPFSSIAQLQAAFPNGHPAGSPGATGAPGSTSGTPQSNLEAFLQSLGINPSSVNLSAITGGQGGSDGGRGLGSGNDNGGQPGSAGEDSIGGLAGRGALSGLMGLGPSGAFGPVGLAMGLAGTMAKEGMLGPAFGNIADSKTAIDNMGMNPSAYGLSNAAVATTGQMTNSESPQQQAAQQAALDAANNQGFSNDPSGFNNDNGSPGIGGHDAGPGNAGGGLGSGKGSGSSSGSGEGGAERGGDDGGGDACFVGDTPILMADGTEKPISGIEVGYLVAAFDKLGPLTGRPVEKIVNSGDVRPTICVNGCRVTSRHPFLMPDGKWTPAGSLVVGDELIAADGSTVKVSSVSHDNLEAPVYNFSVAELHTYVAGGLRVHNSKAKGGIIKGKGGPREDNIPEHLSVGEAVVNNPATKAVGSRFINDLNRIGNAPGSAGAKRKKATRLVKGLR